MPSPKASAQTQDVLSYDETGASYDFRMAVRFGHFPELTIEQNRVIWEAREKGWDVFYPCIMIAQDNAFRTLNGAVEFLKGAK